MRSSSKVFVGKFEAVCTGFIWLVSHGISLEWLKASGGVLFLSTDIFKAKTALSKPSYSFPSITQHDPFLEKKNAELLDRNPRHTFSSILLPSAFFPLLNTLQVVTNYIAESAAE